MRAFQIFTLLIVGALAEPIPIIDQWIVNNVTNAEQHALLRELCVFLEYANDTSYKWSLREVVEKGTGYVHEDQLGGALGLEARKKLQEIYRASENPKGILDFLDTSLEFMKKESPSDTEKLTFFKFFLEDLSGAQDMIHMKMLLEEEYFKMDYKRITITNELLDALGVKIKTEEGPIIDRLIESLAKDSEKASIFFQLKTLIYLNSNFKFNLNWMIRRGLSRFTAKDQEAGAILQKLYEESESPQNVMEFLETCLAFLKKPEPEDSWKWLFLHGASLKMRDANQSLVEMKKALEDGTWKLPAEVLKALGVQRAGMVEISETGGEGNHTDPPVPDYGIVWPSTPEPEWIDYGDGNNPVPTMPSDYDHDEDAPPIWTGDGDVIDFGDGANVDDGTGDVLNSEKKKKH